MMPRSRRRPSAAQWSILNYWAGNTSDTTPRTARGQYAATHGPAPDMQERTWWLLWSRGWLRNGNLADLWVPDAGRVVIGRQLLDRDDACPMAACAARPGERCRNLAADFIVDELPGRPLLWYRPYQERVHAARVFPELYRDVVAAVPATMLAEVTAELHRRITALPYFENLRPDRRNIEPLTPTAVSVPVPTVQGATS